jgi:HAMP domain-containing protein
MVSATITTTGALLVVAIVATIAAGLLFIRRRRPRGVSVLSIDYIEDQFRKPDDESDLL